MNENDIDLQFAKINAKLDKLTELTEQTHLQGYRITKLEESIVKMEKTSDALRTEITKLQHKGGDTALKWLSTIAGGILTVLIGFIAVKVGLK